MCLRATTLDTVYCTLKQDTEEMELWFSGEVIGSTKMSCFLSSKCIPMDESILTCLLVICWGLRNVPVKKKKKKERKTCSCSGIFQRADE